MKRDYEQLSDKPPRQERHDGEDYYVDVSRPDYGNGDSNIPLQKQPTKIKLSLKIGSLKQQTEQNSSYNPQHTENYAWEHKSQMSYSDVDSKSNIEYDHSARNDEDGSDYRNDHANSLSKNLGHSTRYFLSQNNPSGDDSIVNDDDDDGTTYLDKKVDKYRILDRHTDAFLSSFESVSDKLNNDMSHTPRIKLRFSFKSQTQNTIDTKNINAQVVANSTQKGNSTPIYGALHTRSSVVSENPSTSDFRSQDSVPSSPAESVLSIKSYTHKHGASESVSLISSGINKDESSTKGEFDWVDLNDRTKHIGANGETVKYTSHSHTPEASDPAHGKATEKPRRRGRPPLNRKAPKAKSVRKSSNFFTTTVSLKGSLDRLIKRIRKRDTYAFFLEPVNTNVVTDYLSVIETPMDLGTMQNKVENEQYRSIYEFHNDLMLVLNNARKYNGAESIYGKSADQIQAYSTRIIDSETVKLERVGMATLPDTNIPHDSEIPSRYSSPNILSRSQSATPTRESTVDESDAAIISSHIGYGIVNDGRRSSRLRSRAGSETPAHLIIHSTPSSIIESLKWSTASKRRTKKNMHHKIPKRVLETQIKMPLYPDGTLDPIGFDEDIASIPYEYPNNNPPLLLLSKNSVASSASGQMAPNNIVSNGRLFSHADFCDYGPHVDSSDLGNTKNKAAAGMDNIYGDDVGLAYWSSISQFIDGAGEEVVSYASRVLDHLTEGAHSLTRETVELITSENSTTIEEHDTARHPTNNNIPPSEASGKPDTPLMIKWLESRGLRDCQYNSRLKALTGPLCLSDVFSNSFIDSQVRGHKTIQLSKIGNSEKHDLFCQNSDYLKQFCSTYGTDRDILQSNAVTDTLEKVEANLYTLAVSLCFDKSGKAPLRNSQIPAIGDIDCDDSSK